jgi:methyl-accepting chemotaxis protein
MTQQKPETRPAAKGKERSVAVFLALGAFAAAVLSLAIQVYLAGGTPGGAPSEPAGKILLWGGIINIMVFALGLGTLVLNIRRLSRRFFRLKELARPLAEKDAAALLALPKPEPGAAAKEGSAELREAVLLEEALWSLGRLFASFNAFIGRSTEMREIVRGESREGDSLHQHIGEVIDKIAGQFFEIEESAKQAVVSLGDMEAYIHSLAEAGGGHSAMLEETDGRLARVTDMSRSVAARIRDSAGKAESLRGDIATGEEQAQEVNDMVKTIAREVGVISEMTAIINQISEQTNILSMNAAIESAHAGQAGAGFAVVADEIRKLAESTRENAGRIHEELLAIGRNTQGALKASELSFETFNGITGKIGDLTQELADISSAAGETGAMNGEINGALQESVRFSQRLKDGSADMMAHHQSFSAALELIRSLSDTTRTEIKEIHSGTRELLEHLKKIQRHILEDLDQAESLRLSPGTPWGSPAAIGDTPASPGASPAAVSDARGAISPVPAHNAAAQAHGASPAAVPDARGAISPVPAHNATAQGAAEAETYSDSREVTVKRPPQTIL